jgi:hypothetical protein
MDIFDFLERRIFARQLNDSTIHPRSFGAARRVARSIVNN